jgi:RNA recognition motif-containing protein
MKEEPKLWWYVDIDGQCAGPVNENSLVALFRAESVDGMTLVHPDCHSQCLKAPPHHSAEWTYLADVPSLRVRAAAASDPDRPSMFPETEVSYLYELPPPSEMVPPSSNEPGIPSIPTSFPGPDQDEVSSPKACDAVDVVGSTPDMSRAADREAKRISRKRKRAISRARDRAQRTIFFESAPENSTEKEVADFFAKCGIIMPDAKTGRPSVTLYVTAEGKRKGDGKVVYAMEPSVENALLLLDGRPLRDGASPLQLSRATFNESDVDVTTEGEDGKAENEGELAVSKRNRPSPASQRRRPKLTGATRVVVREALGWADEGQKLGRSVRIVVLKNLFDPQDPELDYGAIHEDLESGCADCGPVDKITVFKGNEEGAAIVRFQDGNGARKCVELMHQRWYDKRRLIAEFYDGETDFRIKETEQQRAARLADWDKWLSENDGDDARVNY